MDIIFIYLSNINYIKSKSLKNGFEYLVYLRLLLTCYYDDYYNISRLFYYLVFRQYNLLLFIILAVVVQMIYDLSFYTFFSSVRKGSNQMLDLFKEYAKDMSYKILIVDSLIIIFTCIFASLLANFSISLNIFLFIIFLYLAQYFIYN